MKSLPDLQDEQSHKIKTVDDIVKRVREADRLFTDDEKADIKKLKEEVVSLDATIADVAERDAMIKDASTLTESTKDGNFRSKRVIPAEQPTNTPEGEAGETKFTIPASARRYSLLKAFPQTKEGEERAYRAGQWVRAVFFRDGAAQRWCQRHNMEARALSEGVNTAGGVLVPDELLQTIIDLRDKYGIFRRECDVVPMGRDTMTIPRRAGGVTATFTAENTALTESDPTFNDVQLNSRKLGVFTRISSELAEDAIINLADWVAQEFAWAFAKKEDDCGFKGDGTSTYGQIRGLTNKCTDAAHSASYIVCATATHNTFGEIDATDLITLMAALPEYAEEGAQWICSKVAAELVFGRLMAGGGGNTITEFEGGYRRQYLGYPIVTTGSMPTSTGALTSVPMLAFGNLRLAATLGDRREIRFSTTSERYWDSDQIGVKATQRFDINIHDLGDTSTAGPIVVLKGGTS